MTSDREGSRMAHLRGRLGAGRKRLRVDDLDVRAAMLELGIDYDGLTSCTENPMEVLGAVQHWLADRGKAARLTPQRLPVALTAVEQVLRAMEVRPVRTPAGDAASLQLEANS
jgi:hypothetical protein